MPGNKEDYLIGEGNNQSRPRNNHEVHMVAFTKDAQYPCRDGMRVYIYDERSLLRRGLKVVSRYRQGIAAL